MGDDLGSSAEGLLHLARGGDRRALGRLLDGYRGYLTLLGRLQISRRLRGKVDASDLVQETFLEAHRAFGEFRGLTQQELLYWLRKILVTRIAKLVRRFYGTQRRDVRLEQRLDEEMDRSSHAVGALAGAQSSPSHGAARRETVVLLADALEQLPADHREVIVLRQLEELSFPEVAERMGKSADGARKLWVRALATLRRSFGGTVNGSTE